MSDPSIHTPAGPGARVPDHHIFSQFASLAAAAIGAFVLFLGWGLQVAIAKTLLPGYPAMMPNMAVALILGGFSLWTGSRSAGARSLPALLCAILLLSIGALTCLEYFFGTDLAIDRLLFPHLPSSGEPVPGRMAAVSAVVLVMIAGSLLLHLQKRSAGAGQLLAAAATMLCFLNLVGHLFGVRNFLSKPFDSGMGLPTCIALAILGLGAIYIAPDCGIMAHLTGATPGSLIARRLLPAAILLPPFIGWLAWQGYFLGLYPADVTRTLLASTFSLVFTILIWKHAALLNEIHHQRSLALKQLQESEHRYRELLLQSPVAFQLLDRDGKTVASNPALEKMFAAAHPAIIDGYRDIFDRAFAGETVVTQPLEHSSSSASATRSHWVELTAYPSKDGEGQVEEVVFLWRDVTERELANRNLLQSEALFRALVELIPGIVFMAGPDGANTFTNARFQQYTGALAARLAGNGWLEFVHPDDRKKVAGELLRCIAEAVPCETELRFLRGDGVHHWHLLRAMPLHNEIGDLASLVGICTDIEDYKLAEAAIKRSVEEKTLELYQSEERYRLLIENVQDHAIFMLDPEGRVSSWTGAAARVEGYDAAEILGQSFERFYVPEDIEREHPQAVLEAARRAGHHAEEGWRVRKDGSRFWAYVTITAVHSRSGELLGFSKITHDISERKRIEQQLQDREQQFRILLDCAPDAILIVDSHGALALVNAQAEKLFGYSREELLGRPVEVLIPEKARGGHARHRAGYNEAPRVRRMGTGMELLGLRRNGELFPVEVSLSPIEMLEGVWVAAGVRDITERKTAEEHLIAERRRAEEANQTKSNFLAAMSHEIRTPMNSILGLADLLSETELDHQQRHYVEVFRRAGYHLLTLIDDILDFSKIESGRLDLECLEFDLEDVVDQAIELISPKARSKNLALMSHLMPNLTTALLGDPNRLRQILV
ncbi:MAG: PAS domain S-box protein, partial [Acidobacteriia bacterium]|nr:PAS domain S-box protein [Terriglobia bacterium]